jgi:protein-S-isoprenylcysteine O-methyltransferase Ste14
VTSPPVSSAEQTTAARIGAVLFRYRGFLPVPFLLVPLLVPGAQTRNGWLIGAVFIVLGEAFRLAGVSAAGTVTRRRSRAVQRLVTYGVFSWMRNPLYVGNFLIWIGFVIGSGVLWFIPVAVVLFAIEYTLIVRYEEGVLESIFGADYVAYKQRTPRWFPRPPAAKSEGPHDVGEALRSEVSTFAQYAALALAFYVKWRLLRV